MRMLAGYISGTRADLARVRKRKGKMELYDFESFVSKDFSAFASVLKLYLRKRMGEVDVACFGVAGPVIKNQVRPTNLPWNLIGKKIEEKFSIGRLKLVNDIVATAHGLTQLSSDKFFTINKGKKVESGNVGLIAAGTGLGEALIYTNGETDFPYASEGGHADFAPGSQGEAELWGYIYSEKGHVEAEDVLSLSGLERIYSFLVDTQGAMRSEWFEQAEDRPAMILEKALSGQDETAARTVDIFIDCYAAEAGNLALKGMTLGGIYVGGMIAPRIITMLDKGRFMERFVKRGKMGDLLARMPVGVIIDSNTALLGAAGIAMNLSV
jgi:glucokinase